MLRGWLLELLSVVILAELMYDVVILMHNFSGGN
jgi:hypothetical protein